jgi:hypothetical protein
MLDMQVPIIFNTDPQYIILLRSYGSYLHYKVCCFFTLLEIPVYDQKGYIPIERKSSI